MRYALFLFVLLIFLALLGTAVAYPSAVVVHGSLSEQNVPVVQSYPAIRAWTVVRDRVTAGALISLIRRYNRRMKIPEMMQVVESVLTAALVHDLDPLLIASVIAAESSFYPRALSHCGAEGLMQLTKPVQPWLGVTDPYDIKQNIAGGCRYLDNLKQRFPSRALVLAAYNAGPTRVARLGRVPEIPETLRYISHVNTVHNQLVREVRDRSSAKPIEDPSDPFVSA